MKTVAEMINDNFIYLMAHGFEESYMSLPVLQKDNKSFLLASPIWKGTSKNAMTPTKYLINPLTKGVVEMNELEVVADKPSFFANPTIPFKVHKNLARDLDIIIYNYLTSGQLDELEYISYLEEMNTYYVPEIRRILYSLSPTNYQSSSIFGGI